MDYRVKTNRALETTSEKVDDMLLSIQKKCAAFKWITIVIFTILCIISLLTLILLVVGIGNQGVSMANGCLDLLQASIQCILFSIFIYFIMRVFDDLTKGFTPFSSKEANRVRISGIVLIIESIIDANLPQFVYLASSSTGLLTGLVHIDEPVFGINLGSVISGIAFVGLSFVLQYGALLQDVSDGTV